MEEGAYTMKPTVAEKMRVLRAENEDLKRLLREFLPPHSGYCATVECLCSPERKYADELLGLPVMPRHQS